MTISTRDQSYVLGGTGHEHERLIRQATTTDELNQIFAAPFPVCRHSLSTRRHGDPMIEIVAGDHVPDLPFVIVDRQGGHGRSHRDRGALARKRRCHRHNAFTPADRGGEHVGDEGG